MLKDQYFWLKTASLKGWDNVWLNPTSGFWTLPSVSRTLPILLRKLMYQTWASMNAMPSSHNWCLFNRDKCSSLNDWQLEVGQLCQQLSFKWNWNLIAYHCGYCWARKHKYTSSHGQNISAFSHITQKTDFYIMHLHYASENYD